MAGVVILSATGAGAPVAAGVAVLGAAIWVGGTIEKHYNTIRAFINDSKAVIYEVKNGAFDTVKGWFGR